jgi:hypothetical protein
MMISTTPLPPLFSEAFLAWFRRETEATWSTYASHAPEDSRERRSREYWREHTKWLDGMTDAEIDAAEARWSVRFPPDFRLFLRMLHTVDCPQRITYYDGDQLVTDDHNGLYNWKADDRAQDGVAEPGTLAYAYDWLFERIFEDVQDHNLWRPSWGEKPSTEEQQTTRLRELLAAAPKLIPIFEHRYLLAEPCTSGNMVLSIWHGLDIIVYGADLRDYLLREFNVELFHSSAERRRYHPGPNTNIADEIFHRAAAIPFWGDLMMAWQSSTPPSGAAVIDGAASGTATNA